MLDAPGSARRPPIQPALPDAVARVPILTQIRELGLLGQAWTITVVLFCIARAVPLWPMLQEHDVNPWWFLGLDIGTAPTYGLGQAMGIKILRDTSRPMRDAVPWILMLLISFLAPYLYLLRSAGQLPGYVVIGIIAWIVVFGAIAAVRMVRATRIPAPI